MVIGWTVIILKSWLSLIARARARGGTRGVRIHDPLCPCNHPTLQALLCTGSTASVEDTDVYCRPALLVFILFLPLQILGCDAYLPDCPDAFVWPGWSSLTGEMISNCIGVSGATSESKESADRDAESEPKDPVLLVRVVGGRGCLKSKKQKQENGSVLSSKEEEKKQWIHLKSLI